MSVLHLASSSPRRRDLLEAVGLTFSYAGVDVCEDRLTDEPALQMVERLATAKARAALPREGVVIGADTAVVLGDRVFGKPSSEAEGIAMLSALSGTVHEVMTGVAVASGGRVATVVSRSSVAFRDIDPAEARQYWQSGEPRDKAGGYAIQGLGAVFVQELRGSYTGVVGLPMFETAQLLAAAGIDVLRGAE